MDNVICQFKGFNGQIDLYDDKVTISHRGAYAAMNGCKIQDVTIPLDQIERVQFKRGGMEQGFMQITVKDNQKFCYTLRDITRDENAVTYGYPKNDEAEQFKYRLAQLIGDKPINIIGKIKDMQQLNPITDNEKNIQQFSPASDNEVVAVQVPKKSLSEKRTEFQKRAREANPKMFGDVLTADEKSEYKVNIASRRVELNKQNIVYCPKCASTELTYSKRGYSIGNAILCAIIFGIIGAIFGATGIIIGVIIGILSGFSGSKKVRITCLKCGHQFYPGKK